MSNLLSLNRPGLTKLYPQILSFMFNPNPKRLLRYRPSIPLRPKMPSLLRPNPRLTNNFYNRIIPIQKLPLNALKLKNRQTSIIRQSCLLSYSNLQRVHPHIERKSFSSLFSLLLHNLS